jgi:hypothetical protein
MMLSAYIEGLQEVLREHGDMTAVYATDAEGNAYHPCHYNGIVYYTRDPNESCLEVYSGEDLDEVDEPLTPICVVN